MLGAEEGFFLRVLRQSLFSVPFYWRSEPRGLPVTKETGLLWPAPTDSPATSSEREKEARADEASLCGRGGSCWGGWVGGWGGWVGGLRVVLVFSRGTRRRESYSLLGVEVKRVFRSRGGSTGTYREAWELRPDVVIVLNILGAFLPLCRFSDIFFQYFEVFVQYFQVL